MSIYTAEIHWDNSDKGFLSGDYSRGHSWSFDGGLTVAASSSPQIVPEPMSVAANVDPEEAFVASISSCHMLWFLSLAAKAGIELKSYRDNAVGTMGRNDSKQLAMLKVELNPIATLVGGQTLERSIAEKIHTQAHRQCFIANSVRTEILIHSGGML